MYNHFVPRSEHISVIKTNQLLLLHKGMIAISSTGFVKNIVACGGGGAVATVEQGPHQLPKIRVRNR